MMRKLFTIYTLFCTFFLAFAQEETTSDDSISVYNIPDEINNFVKSNSIGIVGTRFYYPNKYEWKPKESFYQLKLATNDSLTLFINEEYNHSYPKRYENDAKNWSKIKFGDPKYFTKKIQFQEMNAMLNYYPNAQKKGFDAMSVFFGNDSIIGEYTISFPSNNERLQYKVLDMMKEMIWSPTSDVDYEEMLGYHLDLSKSDFTQILPSTKNIYYYLANFEQPDLNPFADFLMITTIRNKSLTEVKEDYLKRYPERYYYNVEIINEEAKKVNKKNAMQAEVLGKLDNKYFKDFYTFIEHNGKILVYKARLFNNDKRLINHVKSLPEKITFTEN